MEQIDLWLKQATNLSLNQAVFLVGLCMLLAGLVANIDNLEGDD